MSAENLMEKNRTDKWMQQAVEYMRRWDMLPGEGGLMLCAVSGGRDSVCLLHFLRGLAGEEGFRLAAAHYEHGLRGEESVSDADFTAELCADWGIPCIVESGDAAALAREKGWSLEEAARHARYAFLERVGEALGADRIATAHHADDNLETLLLNITRGTAGEGLGGIPPVRGRFVRPLLTVPRRALEEYAEAHHLRWREDSSNRDLRFARNRIRHEVLPVLYALNGNAAEAAAHTMAVQREENELLAELAKAELGEAEMTEEGVSVPSERFVETVPCLRSRMVSALLEQSGAGRKDITARHIEAMAALAAHEGGRRQMSLPGGWYALSEDGRFSVLREREVSAQRIPLRAGERVCWGKYTISLEKSSEKPLKSRDTIRLKYDMMNTALCVGPWTRAGSMQLTGARGQRSLKRLFQDAGISPAERDAMPVIYAGDEVCAVPFLGGDVRFLAQEGDEALVLMTDQE